MKILIVEDEIIPANYLKKVLEKEGYFVLNITDKGMQAIQIARQKKPDLILMDVMLKDNISGCDAALEISKRNPEICIVFLTAYSDKEMIDFAISSNAFGYLLKPYRDKEILATIKLAKSQQTKLTKQAPNKIKKTLYLSLVDGYTYNTTSGTLYDARQIEVPCGPQALKLIALLCEHKSHTIKIEMLLEDLWDKPKSQQTLRSLIHRIRKLTSPNIIINVNKLGYKIGLAN